ncbi:MAG TPA: isochorismate synthase [Solirubrobacteraceae bacterium]|nr:isochorismate synthase [Solirubrobacteraceae bacterium]
MPSPTRTAAHGTFALDEEHAARLRAHVETAVRRARRRGSGVLATVTAALPRGADPTAIVVASRGGGEPWTAFEQPARDGFALASLGCAAALEARGERRFAEVAALWRELAAHAVSDAADAPRGSGPVAVGGFAFAPDGGAAPHWNAFAPASLHVPQVALARRGDEARLTLTALIQPDDDADVVCESLLGRAAALRERPLPLLDPDPVGRYRVVSAMPPEHYAGAVARAVERIRAGDLEKIVLAREVQVHAPASYDPAAVLGALRAAFTECHVFCVARGDDAFVAASPELLVRRDGMRAGTLALAGSARRSADPAVDAHLGEQLLRSPKDREEQAIVTRRIVQALRAHSLWVTVADEPVLARIANIQHLATPIRAQLRDPVSVVELAGALHPTPAVGGEPLEVAAPLIPALEGLDRGWYAGPVGWVDEHEDGEFCVALRCALLSGRVARCYAGVGVVRDSDPEAELAETEMKLGALLPVLAG